MADGISTDFSDLTRLAADLQGLPVTAGKFVHTAVRVTSQNVKESANKKVKRSKNWWQKPLHDTIDYDITTDSRAGTSTIEGEIGYNPSRYGKRAKLGNVREFGTPRVTPHSDLVQALHENENDFVYGLSRATEDAEKSVGL